MSALAVSQCANPNCLRTLTSLAEGRLYQFEIVSISISAVDQDKGVRAEEEDPDETPRRETASFWLCGTCAASMTLSLEPSLGLRVVPIGSVAADLEGQSDHVQDC